MSDLIGPQPAPGEDISPALALVNTEIDPHGRCIELLPDARALRYWLRARRMSSGRSMMVTERDLSRMRELRTAIRATFTARAEGRRPSRTAIAAINDAAGLASSTSRLRWSDDDPRVETVWAAVAGRVDVALAQIAVDAMQTLRGERLRLCEAHGCHRMFIAEHRGRRWCSRTCGDRVRVARHHRRRGRSG